MTIVVVKNIATIVVIYDVVIKWNVVAGGVLIIVEAIAGVVEGERSRPLYVGGQVAQAERELTLER